MLCDHIRELIYLIDTITDNIAMERLAEADILLKELPTTINLVFPPMVESYQRPELMEYGEDMQYWVEQLNRILIVIQGKDLFALIDVLHNETKANLIMYLELIEKAGLAL